MKIVVIFFLLIIWSAQLCVGVFSKLVGAKKSNAVKPHGDITKKTLNNIFSFITESKSVLGYVSICNLFILKVINVKKNIIPNIYFNIYIYIYIYIFIYLTVIIAIVIYLFEKVQNYLLLL